ncbi:MAG: hypothetical protein IPJ22_11945 [Bacteroidetes bacterium]|nr:hypothetical protein [Bacteroidota bacterium]
MTLYSNRGQYRLTISTILTHLVVFHEAGFEYSLERKINLPYVWWNPSTYFGYEWRKSSRPTAPNITEFTFIQGADIKRNPFDFNVSRISEKDILNLAAFLFLVVYRDPIVMELQGQILEILTIWEMMQEV